ncbi:hypothetical protein [uncultured Microbacterium sp.]|uniref:hypothetical protein n=1 Tax=uncultured Microbacterium sp. TaxID=191216 RepID=UPI0025CE0113|nr:hypothetical protein [uncultured Microbacterium sp.]
MSVSWYTADDAAAQSRVVGAWKDAPLANLEVLGMLLDIAREQVLEYAPALDTEVGDVVPGALTVARRNLAKNPSATSLTGFSRAGGGTATIVQAIDDTVAHSGTGSYRQTVTAAGQSGTLLAADIVPGPVRWSMWVRSSRAVGGTMYAEGNRNGSYAGASGGSVSVPAGVWTKLEGYSDAAAVTSPGTLTGWRFGVYGLQLQVGDVIHFDEFLIEQGVAALGDYFDGNTPPLVVGGRTYSQAWDGPENGSSSVRTYRPDVFVPAVPTRFVWAQLQHAKHLWNAGRVAANGETGGGEFTFVPRPLDKDIQYIIRPRKGVPHVF